MRPNVEDPERIPSAALDGMARQFRIGLGGAGNSTLDYTEDGGRHHRLELSMGPPPVPGDPRPIKSSMNYFRAEDLYQEGMVPQRLSRIEMRRIVSHLSEASGRSLVDGIVWCVTAERDNVDACSIANVHCVFDAVGHQWEFGHTTKLYDRDAHQFTGRSMEELAEHHLTLFWHECLSHLPHYVGDLAAAYVQVSAQTILTPLLGVDRVSIDLRARATDRFRERRRDAIVISVAPVQAVKRRRRMIRL